MARAMLPKARHRGCETRVSEDFILGLHSEVRMVKTATEAAVVPPPEAVFSCGLRGRIPAAGAGRACWPALTGSFPGSARLQWKFCLTRSIPGRRPRTIVR